MNNQSWIQDYSCVSSTYINSRIVSTVSAIGLWIVKYTCRLWFGWWCVYKRWVCFYCAYDSCCFLFFSTLMKVPSYYRQLSPEWVRPCCCQCPFSSSNPLFIAFKALSSTYCRHDIASVLLGILSPIIHILYILFSVEVLEISDTYVTAQVLVTQLYFSAAVVAGLWVTRLCYRVCVTVWNSVANKHWLSLTKCKQRSVYAVPVRYRSISLDFVCSTDSGSGRWGHITAVAFVALLY